MNPLNFFSGIENATGNDLKSAVQAFGKQASADLSLPHYDTRYGVIGIAPLADSASGDVSLAVISVVHEAVQISDIFQVNLRGADPNLSSHLRALLTFMGNSPWVSFRSDYGLKTLNRYFEEACAHRIDPDWLDLAALLPACFPEEKAHCALLDDWLRRYELDTDRPDAVSDALSSARLFLRVLGVRKPGEHLNAGELFRAQKAHRSVEWR